MELRDLIVKGNEFVESQTELAAYLGIARNNLTDAKAGRRGLPEFASVKLASLLGIDPMTVIAASVLVTEKNPERRAVFAPFVQESANDALMRIAKTVNKAVGKARSLN